MQDIGKKPNINYLIKLFVDFFPDEYERYGSRLNKEQLKPQDFISAIEKCYQGTQSEVKGRHFFRSQGAQRKFREKNKLTEEDAADHIFSTALFRTVVMKFWPEKAPGLTYDYWMSSKTIINQCWNFQSLPADENMAKGNTEKFLIDLIEASKFDDIKKNSKVMTLIIVIKKALEKGMLDKNFWPQSRSVQAAILAFFDAVGQPLVIGTKDQKTSCSCQLCNYVRAGSRRWRAKYYILYQNPRDDIEILNAVNMDILSSFFHRVWPMDRETATAYFTRCKNQGVNDIWTFMQCYELIIPEVKPVHRHVVVKNIRDTITAHIIKKIKNKRKPENIKKTVQDLRGYCPEDIQNHLDAYCEDEMDKEELLQQLQGKPLIPGDAKK
jgi:hypothetical protein